MDGRPVDAVANQYEREWHFNSEPARVRRVVFDIQRYLEEKIPGQTPEERGDLRLILSELLYNAVIHGNGSNADKQVHIRLTIKERRVFVSIMDEGVGYGYVKLQAPDNGDEALFRESGRGMQLVWALADNVTVSSNGSCVTFVKHIGAKHG